MAEIPTTSTTLLRDIAKDAQHIRWDEFVVRYRPMMEAFLHERFPSVEADDIIQETLIALCRILPSYRYAPDEKGNCEDLTYVSGTESSTCGSICSRGAVCPVPHERDRRFLRCYEKGEKGITCK